MYVCNMTVIAPNHVTWERVIQRRHALWSLWQMAPEALIRYIGCISRASSTHGMCTLYIYNEWCRKNADQYTIHGYTWIIWVVSLCFLLPGYGSFLLPWYGSFLFPWYGSSRRGYPFTQTICDPEYWTIQLHTWILKPSWNKENNSHISCYRCIFQHRLSSTYTYICT